MRAVRAGAEPERPDDRREVTPRYHRLESDRIEAIEVLGLLGQVVSEGGLEPAETGC